ncbi:hypothetical protein NPIL_614281 [Nephila pilipes]|uniref:Uncharacterized protein n=1 Tax=Nephila pilipes TaxID=299642 RepID=A0A8X6T9Z7_NEPPI|nr:hypothetical protein NPIL_614281 [Nephila pilipes]
MWFFFEDAFLTNHTQAPSLHERVACGEAPPTHWLSNDPSHRISDFPDNSLPSHKRRREERGVLHFLFISFFGFFCGYSSAESRRHIA